MMASTHKSLRRRGMTLIEMLISMLIMTMLLGAVGYTVLTGTGAYQEGVITSQLDAQLTRILSKIADELTDAEAANLRDDGLGAVLTTTLPPLSETGVRYHRAEGFAAGAPQWTTDRVIQVQYDASDPNDGIDNNNNGLIDESRVVLIRDFGLATQNTVQWGGFVREFQQGETFNGADDNGNGLLDERGLCFTVNEDSGLKTVTIFLTLEKLDQDGRLVTRSAQTTVQLRN